MKHLGSTLGIIFGILTIGAGLSQINTGGVVSTSYLTAGIQLILGSLAYRWAKKRKYQEIPNSMTRKISEYFMMFIVVSLTVFSNNLKTLIATDPIPNFIIPLWIVVAYIIALFKKPKLNL